MKKVVEIIFISLFLILFITGCGNKEEKVEEVEEPSTKWVEVPIEVSTIGTVAVGKTISSIEVSETTVKVTGKKSVLKELDAIKVEIDVDGLIETKTFNVQLAKPEGIKKMRVNEITVEVSLADVVSKTINVYGIESRNLKEGYIANLTTPRFPEVIIEGEESVIEKITADDIAIYVDLEGYEPGEHRVDVKVDAKEENVKYMVFPSAVTVRISTK